MQESGGRDGDFPAHPAKLVGAPLANTFEAGDGTGDTHTFKGRVTEFLFARITGQGLTPLCAPSPTPQTRMTARFLHPAAVLDALLQALLCF